jgi:hypothetical protein
LGINLGWRWLQSGLDIGSFPNIFPISVELRLLPVCRHCMPPALWRILKKMTKADPFVDQGVGSSDLQASSFVQLTGQIPHWIQSLK